MKQNKVFETLFANRARLLPDTPTETDEFDSIIDFTFGHPDPSLFPFDRLNASIADVMSEAAKTALQYSNFRGSDVLVESLRSYLSKRSGVEISAKNLIITSGSMQAIGLMAQIFIDPGDLVLVEAPTYFRAATIFRNGDAQIEEIPVDKDGLSVDSAEEVLKKLTKRGKKPKFLYTIPTHQNPSGTTLPFERRQGLLELSSQYGFMLLEDTAYNDLWYDSKPPPSLFELDTNDNVIQIGTFSKLIAPGLSIGWAIGPEPVINRFVEFKVNGGTTPFTAHITADFISKADFNDHVEDLRSQYKQKRDKIVSCIETHLNDLVTWHIPGGGYFIWMQTRQKISHETLWQSALREKVLYLPGEYCYANDRSGQLPLIRLAFSALSADEIQEGAIRLERAIRNSL